MNWQGENPELEAGRGDASCETVRENFGAYLDGTMSGVEMSAMAAHLDECRACSDAFAEERLLQTCLAEMGSAQPPARLQEQILDRLAWERANGTHLPFGQRLMATMRYTLAPMMLRVSAGMTVAALLIGGLVWMFAPSLAVQASDEDMAHLVQPHFMYSEVPPMPIVTRHDAPVIVEALVDKDGRVYDYQILEGPADPAVRLRVEQNLLSSVFQPATVFGVPVNGHVLVTYTGVNVTG